MPNKNKIIITNGIISNIIHYILNENVNPLLD